MTLRSWLIVPGHSESALAQAARAGADAVVVDLCLTVPGGDKAAARALCGQWLRAYREPASGGQGMARWVRISAFASGGWHDDLMAALGGGVDGVILPDAAGPEAVRQLGTELYEYEQRMGVPANSTRIMPIVGEAPRTALRIAEYAETAHPRLAGLTWRPEGLAAALGVAGQVAADTGSAGSWSDPLSLVRTTCLLTARAAGIAAVDAACPPSDDPAIFDSAVVRARRDGFTGMFASHPEQIGAINAAFGPAPEAAPTPILPARRGSAQEAPGEALVQEGAQAGAAPPMPGLMQRGLIRRAPILRST